MSFLAILWLDVLSFVLHELEEWNITKFERRNFVEFPSTATAQSARAWIAFICTVGVVWCAAATLPGSPVFAAYLFSPALVAMLLNAIQHVYWSFLFSQYAPGVITSVVLLIPLNGYLLVRSVLHGYIPIWYGSVLVGGLVLGLINTVTTGKQTPHAVHVVYRIGYTISGKFRKRI